jgi:hypothetical protein
MAADGGFYLGTDLKNKTFYGFREIVSTGQCLIEIIKNGNGVVSTPDVSAIQYPNPYVNWVWSTDTYQFHWDNEGHLIMVMV